MATLGDKQYTYSYYGTPDTMNKLWYKTGDTDAFAACVYPTVYGVPGFYDTFVTDGIYYAGNNPSPHNGQPLETSIALWHIPKNASFACNSVFNIEQNNTLSAHFTSNTENSNVPLAMLATDIETSSYGTFGANPVDRYAYDTTSPCNGGFSRPIYDIAYNKFCLYPRITMLNTTTGTQSTVALQAVASTIGNNEIFEVSCIRSDLYYGMSPRTTNAGDSIPSQGYHETHIGVPTIDTLSNRPVPVNEVYLKSKIKDGHSEWRDDVTYSPWYQRYALLMYSTDAGHVFNRQNDIGFDRQLSASAIRNGARTIDSGHTITAQIYRCNTDTKDFDDVSYKWDVAIYDDANKVHLDNGFNISSYANNATFRFYTKLTIVDKKGNSYGKAVELAVKHELAYIGFYFADTQTIATNTELGTAATGVYLPLFNGGVTTGEYVTGDDIPLQPHATAGSVADDTFKYRPEMTDGDSGDLQTILHSDKMSGSTKWYSFDELDVYLLSQWLNTTYKPSDIQLTEDFKGVNPADYIVSIKYYPFDVPAGSTEALSIGGIPVEVSGTAVSVNTHSREYGEGSNSYFDLGSFTLQPPYIYGDFRDTYIKLLLYIPWCGFVTLDPSVYCQSPDGTYHTIRAALSIDFATGSCIGMVYRDGTLIDTVNGTVGVDVPLTAVSNGSYQNAIKQTEIALKNAKAQQLTAYLSTAGALAGGIVSAATGNVAGVAASAAAFAGAATKTEQLNNTIEGLQYQLTHTAPAIGDISSASPFNAALNEQTAKLFIFRPVMLQGTDLQAYGKTTGFACCKAAQLSKFSGFTVCADVDLSGFEAPAHHKLLIKQALQKGVYL